MKIDEEFVIIFHKYLEEGSFHVSGVVREIIFGYFSYFLGHMKKCLNFY
jgi:hypothetical protein